MKPALNEYYFLHSYSTIFSLHNHLDDQNSTLGVPHIWKSVVENFPAAIEVLQKIPQRYVGDLGYLMGKLIEDKWLEGFTAYGKLLAYNTFSAAVQKKVFTSQNQLKPFDPVLEENIRLSTITDEQISILRTMHQNNLWTSEDGEIIQKFLCTKIANLCKKIIKESEKDSIQLEKEPFQFFERLYSRNNGINYLNDSWKQVKKPIDCKTNLKNLSDFIGEDLGEVLVVNCREKDVRMTVSGYCNNSRIYQYKSQVFALRNYLQTLIIGENDLIPPEDVYWFYFYALMRRATDNMGDVYQQSLRGARLTEILESMEIMKAEQLEKQYANLLDTEMVEKAFSIKPEGESDA